ncbi:MAG TPA: DUF2071 domain-containing protein [Microthrixaceae bacterium]|nr:DUF2071 domain-containing protein [Microthrixaceae bacterium]
MTSTSPDLLTPEPSSGWSGTCPFEVAQPVMLHEWRNLTFLHWRYSPSEVQRLLPSGLEVETFDGSAWVGLVPFEMVVTPPTGHEVPWLSRFPETNVRTYVRAADGSTGVWFLSLDAARLAAVVTARATYHLPYYWSRMSVRSGLLRVEYRSRRRWPSPRGPRSAVTVDIGAPFGPDELGDLDHWLTARFRLYALRGGGVGTARAAHPPWPLYRAEVEVDDELVTAAGLSMPVGQPLAHWSPGVAVDIGPPERLGPVAVLA